jgi:hypothetical protein
MDNRVKCSNDIRYAIDAQFSGVTKNPEMRQNVLRQVRGEIVVKKKLSVGFVLVIVLLLVTVTALAVTALSGYFNGYAQLENTHGEYSNDWPTSAKVELIRLMRDNGMAVDQEKTEELLGGNLTAEKQEMLASEVIEEYFEGTQVMNTYNIMLHELGQFEGWPYEQKALYSSLLVKYGHQKVEWPLYLMPEASDIQEKDAVDLALKKLSEKFGTAEHLGNFPVVENTFFISEDYGEAPVWLIEFRNPDAFAGAYSVVLSRQGDIISFKAPDTLPFTGNDDILAKAKFAEPAAHDATKEQAIETAKFALGEIGSPFSKSEIEALTAKAYFIYHERFCYGWAPVWLVYMYNEDMLVYKALLGYDGSYMDIVPAEMEFTNTILPGENFGDSHGVRFHELGFWEGSVEEKADFSQKWIPIVEEFMKTHPYYVNQNDAFYLATRHVYGIPGEGDITQEEALKLAQQAIIALGASESTVSERRIEYSFDITDAKHPLWKLVFGPVDSSDKYAIYRVIIDARAKEVINAFIVPNDMHVEDYRF